MKGLIVAFSMYSKIPMPRFEWDTKDMKYHLCFFPLVGLVIGLFELGWLWICRNYIQNDILYACLAVAIPLLVTGGFHVDGFLDSMDAFHSYQPREKKLEILKDPHIGAFAVICFATYLLVAVGTVSALFALPDQTYATDHSQYFLQLRTMVIASFSFVLSRIGSGLGVTYLMPAKKDGMLHTESANNGKRVVGISLWIQLVISAVGMIFIDYVSALVALSVFLLFFLFYKKKVYKEFGGITGDTAGFYVTMTELLMVVAVAVTYTIRVRG